MPANPAIQNDRLRLALTESSPASAAALLEIALQNARQLGQTDLSKTQLRAVYTAVRRLQSAATEKEVLDRLAVVMARLAYLNEVAQRSYQLSRSREALYALFQLAQRARSIVAEPNGQPLERAERLVELFQAIVAYQARLRTSRGELMANSPVNSQEKIAGIIERGDGAAMFEVAHQAVQASLGRNGQSLDLSKTQLRNIFGTLKVLQTARRDETTLWRLRLLEPRLLYALSRDPQLNSIVEVFYYALQKLFETANPAAYVPNFIRLGETVVALQVYVKAGLGRAEVTEGRQDSRLRKAIEQDDGGLLNDLAKEIGQQLPNLARGQVRNLYDTVRRLEIGGFDTADLQELRRLRATLRYATAREKRLETLFKPLEEALLVVFEPDKEAEQKRRAEWLADFFEAIVAWQTVAKAKGGETGPIPMTKEELTKALGGDEVVMAEIAEKVATKLRPEDGKKAGLSRGQLRSVFAMLKQESTAARFAEDKDLPRLKRRLWLLVPRFEYAAAREPGLESLKEVARQGLAEILSKPELTRNQLASELANLSDLLEGILAFYVIN